ncbi:MAG: 30S ribosomal protein S16 [Alphaproteobacteria bacterium]|nr:30S ribosomal protein S16 [Alphaproteobacteria bacterium]
MVKLRLTRMGAKKKPFYRIVAADSRVQRDGRWIEQIGWYDPMRDPKALKLDLARVDHWIGVGAQPTETVGRLIEKARSAEVTDAGVIALPKRVRAPKAEAAPAEAEA